MRAKLYILTFVFFFIIGLPAAFSQKRTSKGLFKHEKLNLLANLGFSTYYGDLCDKFECMVLRPALGIGYIYRFTNHFQNKTEINYYRLSATDVYPERNLNFRSGNVEFYTSAMLDFYSYTKHFPKRKRLNPYIFAGVGLTYFNPSGQHPSTGEWVALRPLETEGKKYMPLTLILPFGLGVKIKFHRNYDFMVEAGYRKTFSDHMDDVSSFNYQDLASFGDNELAKIMSLKAPNQPELPSGYRNTYLQQQRGNPKKLDGYFLFNVKVRYIYGASRGAFKGKHPLLQPHHK